MISSPNPSDNNAGNSPHKRKKYPGQEEREEMDPLNREQILHELQVRQALHKDLQSHILSKLNSDFKDGNIMILLEWAKRNNRADVVQWLTSQTDSLQPYQSARAQQWLTAHANQNQPPLTWSYPLSLQPSALIDPIGMTIAPLAERRLSANSSAL